MAKTREDFIRDRLAAILQQGENLVAYGTGHKALSFWQKILFGGLFGPKKGYLVTLTDRRLLIIASSIEHEVPRAKLRDLLTGVVIQKGWGFSTFTFSFSPGTSLAINLVNAGTEVDNLISHLESEGVVR